MPKTLKIESDASQRFQTTLGGQTVILRLYWNTVSASWFLDLYKPDGTAISTGRRLSTNTPVFAGVLVDFEGDLVPQSYSTPATELARDSWGTTHNLVYYATSESIY